MATIPEPLEQVAIALGSNLGDSRGTLEQALDALGQSEGVRLLCRSSWYRSAPIGPVQPDYVNGCALLEVSLAPEALLDVLQGVENRFGRVRAERWGARTLDLDLLLHGIAVLVCRLLHLAQRHVGERGGMDRIRDCFGLVPGGEVFLRACQCRIGFGSPARLRGGGTHVFSRIDLGLCLGNRGARAVSLAFGISGGGEREAQRSRHEQAAKGGVAWGGAIHDRELLAAERERRAAWFSQWAAGRDVPLLRFAQKKSQLR
jgi:2-amino-4-hydroxy-6-hydroxymethyldihydropteridine diphosphokinase